MLPLAGRGCKPPCGRGPFLLSCPLILPRLRSVTEVIPCVSAALFWPWSCSLRRRGAEIFPFKGETIKGDIVRVSDSEVVIKQDGKDVTKPIKEVLRIDYRDVGKPDAASYSQIELTDGTTLLVSKWLIKKRDVELTLVAGPVVKLPLDVVANVLHEAHVELHRRDWKTRVYNTRNRDALVVAREGVISSIECTLGDGNDGRAPTISIRRDHRRRDRDARPRAVLDPRADLQAHPGRKSAAGRVQAVGYARRHRHGI